MAFLLIAAGACSNDDDKTVPTMSGGPTLLAPENGREFVLLPDNQDDILTTFIWDHSSFGVGTSANYTLEIAKAGTNFADPIEVGTPNVTDRFITITVKELNDALPAEDFAPYVENEIEARIKATIGTSNQMSQYSNVLSLLVTPYSNDLPTLGVPGAHQGWNPGAADLPRLASRGYGNFDYQGYVWLDGEYKFLAPAANGTFSWDNPNWGDDGSFSNVLQPGGGNANAAAGYYLLKANTADLSYSATPVVWGIVGAATPGGWDNSTALTYNATTKLWEGIVTLTSGEFKFRANNSWDINLGNYDANQADITGEEMSYGGPNLVNAAAGSYKVTLDLSHPRAYTYTLTPQ